ncbi:hypothetical protein TRVA0_048S00694 [Trichomonascus vanleenenianus]|uniref:uncharacterized protein n=1 Tax=Trichomonascus vanleenenianus TaxID=2268995 RepID=UPI003ECA83EC
MAKQAWAEMRLLAAQRRIPPVLYIMDMKFTVRHHVAPQLIPYPYARDFKYNWISNERREERSKLTPIEWCLRNPPSEGEFGAGTLDLLVLDTFQAGYDYGSSQVVLVEAQSELERVQKGQKLVAKVYDPLYIDDDGDLDVYFIANEFYTREVRAYQELSELQGGSVPKFYGSFSLDVHIPESFLMGIDNRDLKTRQVRLILTEYIPGSSMYRANPKNYSQQARQQVIKSLIDFDSEAFQRNVILRDLWPRNVIIPETGTSQDRKMVCVDLPMLFYAVWTTQVAPLVVLFYAVGIRQMAALPLFSGNMCLHFYGGRAKSIG